MKKILFIIFVFLALPLPVFAQETGIGAKVDELKDKVASRVAELNLIEKRGIIGTVEEVKGAQVTITDVKGNTRIIDTDELTKFSSEDNNNYDLSDVEKGSKISALGLYNKDSERLLARFLNEISVPLFLNGVITSKNDKDFTITLSTEEGNSYTIDVERVTKTYTFLDGDLEAGGFTKISTGENAAVVGFTDPKDDKRITAGRLITFPGTPKNPKVEVSITASLSPSPTATSTPEE